MNKPTPHRLLHDALEPEVYAKVMRNTNPEFVSGVLEEESLDGILLNLFHFKNTDEGAEFWFDVSNKLFEKQILQQEQLDNE